MANGNGNGGRLSNLLGNIFTEKVVGLAFAIAFGSWAWNLNSLENTVNAVGSEIKSQIEQQHIEIEMIKDQHIKDREAVLRDLIAIREKQIAIMERLARSGM